MKKVCFSRFVAKKKEKMRKKVDERVRTLIENGVKNRHRSMFVVVGDKHHYQVVNLHYMLCKATVKPMASVLWCYKKSLQLSSHKKKRMKQVKKLRKRGLLDAEKEDPFLLFADSGNIRYCYYSETENILGGTYGMCVLQDFEGLTPNILARTIETVEGGGLILLLLSSLSSLSSLFTMVMDVHKRFRTESHPNAASRFNERFLLSLASCETCVVMDDEMNILPISSHIRSVTPESVLEVCFKTDEGVEVDRSHPFWWLKGSNDNKAVVNFLAFFLIVGHEETSNRWTINPIRMCIGVAYLLSVFNEILYKMFKFIFIYKVEFIYM